MIRAHVDYALMALFNLGFWGSGIELPVIACWCVAIGGFTNPTVFVIAAFDPEFWGKKKWRVYSAISFVITTIGFVGVGYTLIQHALARLEGGQRLKLLPTLRSWVFMIFRTLPCP